MFCMKCGRETAADQVFCDGCLQVMKQYPVKPGTAVQLPKRVEAKQPSPRKKLLSSKEQLRLLRRKNKRLRRAVAILAVAFCLVSAMLAYTLFREHTPALIGKNYTIDTSLAP